MRNLSQTASGLFVLSLQIIFATTAIAGAAVLPAAEPRYASYIPVSGRSPRPNVLLNIFRRQQGDCQSGYVTCASISAPEACCPTNTLCARDPAGNIACCPVNNVCTGFIGSSSGTAQPTQSTSTPNGGGTVTVTSTAGVTSAPVPMTGPQQSFTLTAGTVQNEYYPYPVIVTAFPNPAACTQAYAYCQIQSTSCYQSLAGNNAVTISNGMGEGGITQGGGGAGNTNPAVAASAGAICSSLSVRACYGLRETQCTATPGGGSQVIQPGAAKPRETGFVRAGGYAAVGLVGAIGLVF